ncbi:hypothetical protein PAXRUDRAFT_830971 [Paxillus rubicundulus Ve08.2h10]|uniref:Unplaced genomic scaffold scaffold_582, whole genome shotgun sequence n=1 Tax=Paxillus rubicundulus Ve08.2h10 TaxID=930991 RepID=A0A0D0E2Z8_9AGAM|nr:hypothetical protein PAXRUDRAFT_830971 [Paxillus rubicundulus Ve08.2h10]
MTPTALINQQRPLPHHVQRQKELLNFLAPVLAPYLHCFGCHLSAESRCMAIIVSLCHWRHCRSIVFASITNPCQGHVFLRACKRWASCAPLQQVSTVFPSSEYGSYQAPTPHPFKLFQKPPWSTTSSRSNVRYHKVASLHKRCLQHSAGPRYETS